MPLQASGIVEPVSIDGVDFDMRAEETNAGGNYHRRKKTQVPLLILSFGLMMVGVGGSILNRVYFLHGGSRIWFSSLLQVVAFPVLLVPLIHNYLTRTGDRRVHPVLALNRRSFAALVVIGLFNGLVAYFYSYGASKLPVSTSTILFATQLAFTAAAAFLIVRQRFTPYTINAVFLLILGAVVLGLQADHDRPEGITNGKYFLGFALMLTSAAVFGVMLPVIELTYGLTGRRPTYALYLEAQIVISAVSTVFCLVGMAINRDFQAMSREAAAFGLGENKYWLVIVFCSLLYQAVGLGFMGVIGCASSLVAGIGLAFLIPIGEILAVICLHEKFSSSKGVSVVLAVWGFGSYLYGDWTREKKVASNAAVEV